jgi:hypothetical protein
MLGQNNGTRVVGSSHRALILSSSEEEQHMAKGIKVIAL